MPLIAGLLLAASLFGCDCPGEMTVVSGGTTVEPGGVVQFAWHYDGRTVASPTRCEGHWSVDGIEGGDAVVGRIDGCGRYVAPAVIEAPRRVTVVGSTEAPGTCHDCCPYASKRLRLVP